MKKHTKVKKNPLGKYVNPSKKLKKYEEGGRKILSEYTDPSLKEVTGIKNQNALGDLMSNPVKADIPAIPKISEDTKSTIPSIESKTAIPKTPAKKIAGGFSSEAQKSAYIKNVKDRMSKGATLDQLVKEGIGTKSGLEGLGFKDAVKASPIKSKKKSITLPKNNVLSSVGRKGLVNTGSTPLPKNSRVPLANKNTTITRTKKSSITLPKNNVLSAVGRKGQEYTGSTPLPKNSRVPLANKDTKKVGTRGEGLKLKGKGMKLKGEGMKLKGQALLAKGKKQSESVLEPKQKNTPIKKDTIKPIVKPKPIVKTPETKKKISNEAIKLKKKGQELTKLGKKQANSYTWSPERNSKETKSGRIDTIVNTKQNGNKQTKVNVYNKKGDKTKSYYKESGPRYTVEGGKKSYINKKGTILTEISADGINTTITKGRNIERDSKNKGSLKPGMVVDKKFYSSKSGLKANLDFTKNKNAKSSKKK